MLSGQTTPRLGRPARAAAWVLSRVLRGRVLVLVDRERDSAMAADGFASPHDVAKAAVKHARTIEVTVVQAASQHASRN